MGFSQNGNLGFITLRGRDNESLEQKLLIALKLPVTLSGFARIHVSGIFHSLALRKALERLNDHQLDTIVKKLDGKLGQFFANSQKVNMVKLAGYLLKPFLLTRPEK